MAERWQTSEGRVAAVFFRDSTGAPATGLTPTASSNYKDGTAGAPAATVVEVGNGFYRVTFASALTKDVLVRVDGGATLTTTRYAALEVPVGGYVDLIDVAISTRATAAALTALTAAVGTPAQAAALATLQAAVTALGAPAQAAALSALSALVTALGSPSQAAVLATDLALILAAIQADTLNAHVEVV